MEFLRSTGMSQRRKRLATDSRPLVYGYYHVILNSRKSKKSSSTAQIAAFLQGFLAMAEEEGL
jgi:hypothetical protein